MPTRRLENLGCRFGRTISIWSWFLGGSIILATFALQQLTKEEIDLSGLCLVVSNSRLDTSMLRKRTESETHEPRPPRCEVSKAQLRQTISELPH